MIELQLVPPPAIYGEPYFKEQALAQVKVTLCQVVSEFDSRRPADQWERLAEFEDIIEELRKLAA